MASPSDQPGGTARSSGADQPAGVARPQDSARPRVLVVTPWYPNADRPLEAPFNARHVAAIAQHAEVRVVHVRIGSRAKPSVDVVNGQRVERLPLNPRQPLSVLRTLARIARMGRGADILHTMAFSGILAVAPIRALLPRVWVHSEHWSGLAGGHDVWARRARYLRWVLRLPTVVTAVSSELARVLARNARKVEVIPNVVEAATPPAPFPPDAPLRLVTVGTLIERKQPILAVRTLARLLEQEVDAAIVFVGDGPLREAVLMEASRLGVADRVKVTGFVAPDRVPSYLAEAHVFLLPTLVETFLVGGAEAIAAGRPVVLGGRGGFTDYVEPGNGCVVADHTPEAYAQAILDVHERLTDPLAIAATIGTRYSTAAVGRQFAELYSYCMNSRDGRFLGV